jgi:hypothetical protein
MLMNTVTALKTYKINTTLLLGSEQKELGQKAQLSLGYPENYAQQGYNRKHPSCITPEKHRYSQRWIPCFHRFWEMIL